MAKCLVTKLNGSISNAGLLRLGEMRIKFNKVLSPSKNTQYISINVSKSTNLEIIGEGYFTDENLSANNGKTKTIDTTTKVFVSNNTLELAILDKYNLVRIFDYDAGNVKNKELDIEAVSYSKGLTELNVRSVQLSGDISALKNLTALTTLSFDNNQLSGDISALKNLTALTVIRIVNVPGVFGNLSNLSNLVKLREINMQHATISGDIATLPSSVCFISLFNNKGTTTWSTRPTSSKIIALESVSISNIDEMLINQANCQTGYKVSDPSYYKVISASGTRTTASDDAVATLQQKGYTISIEKA